MKDTVLAILAMVLVIACLMVVGGIENTYVRKGCVVVERRGYTTVVEDKTGNLWEFEGDYYKVGDVVNLKMSANNTNSIYDDTIVKVYQ